MKDSKHKIVVILFVLLLLFLMLVSCSSKKVYEYYSNTNNYLSVTGKISHISLADETKTLYVALDDMSVQLSDNCFKIVGDNLRILLEKISIDELQIGNQAMLITAPKIFGDGYIMPVVSVTIDGVELLEFENGVENLLSWLESR